MERQYLITIDAKKAHHPTRDDIFEAVRDLVAKRTEEFPTANGRTHVQITKPFKKAA